jgi:hypothetical protein
MKKIKQLTLGLMVIGLASCSELQVQRDLKHADISQQYRASLSTAVDFDPERLCTKQGAIGAWTTIDFSATTPKLKLPSGLNAEATCIGIPKGARVLQLNAGATGGATYYEMTIVHPSLQFLDESHKLVKDMQNPKLSPGESLFSGLGLSGNVVMTSDLDAAKYVLVYVHPLSLDGSIDVQTGYQSIPVLYSPYGQVKVRFQ